MFNLLLDLIEEAITFLAFVAAGTDAWLRARGLR